MINDTKQFSCHEAASQIVTKFSLPELVTSQRPPQYIHVGDTISLVCDLKVKTESELASVKWYIGSEEIDDTKLFDNADFDVGNTLKKTTYTDAVPDKTEGGIYKCEFTFTVGDTISLETTVAIHCEYLNLDTLCSYIRDYITKVFFFWPKMF